MRDVLIGPEQDTPAIRGPAIKGRASLHLIHSRLDNIALDVSPANGPRRFQHALCYAYACRNAVKCGDHRDRYAQRADLISHLRSPPAPWAQESKPPFMTAINGIRGRRHAREAEKSVP